MAHPTSTATLSTSSPSSSTTSASRPHIPPHNSSNNGHSHLQWRRPRGPFVNELSQCLLDFVIQLLPPTEEVAVKEDVRKLLEKLIKTIEPESRLLSFGSTANGFELKNSDMDLCCLLNSKQQDDPMRTNPSQFVLRAAQLLERETKFIVKPLPNARIPIIKLSLQASPSIPFGIACDIGFENRLALENTRLLYTYAALDPTRVRTLVLFLKLWSKRRKINNPYLGTLSSYGYALLVIYFLVHVKNPPVLPNLQQIPPLRPISHEEMHINGRNVWFFDDVELLKRRWQSSNTESIAELLIDFFKYFSREFAFNTTGVSIRMGPLSKETLETNRTPDPRDGNNLWIEDPFETDFNVARCVTKDGLYTIRGEFMRASRILSQRPERAMMALADLCEERGEELPRNASHRPYVPTQSRYQHQVRPNQVNHLAPAGRGTHSEGASPMADSRPILPQMQIESVVDTPTQETVTGDSVTTSDAPTADTSTAPCATTTIKGELPEHIKPPLISAPIPVPTPPPPHMAPQRSKWTKPPSAEASPTRKSSFEERLNNGLKLAVNHNGNGRTFRKSRGSPSTTTTASSFSGDEEEIKKDRETLFGTPPITENRSSRSGSPTSSVSGVSGIALELGDLKLNSGTEHVERRPSQHSNNSDRYSNSRRPRRGSYANGRYGGGISSRTSFEHSKRGGDEESQSTPRMARANANPMTEHRYSYHGTTGVASSSPSSSIPPSPVTAFPIYAPYYAPYPPPYPYYAVPAPPQLPPPHTGTHSGSSTPSSVPPTSSTAQMYPRTFLHPNGTAYVSPPQGVLYSYPYPYAYHAMSMPFSPNTTNSLPQSSTPTGAGIGVAQGQVASSPSSPRLHEGVKDVPTPLQSAPAPPIVGVSE